MWDPDEWYYPDTDAEEEALADLFYDPWEQTVAELDEVCPQPTDA